MRKLNISFKTISWDVPESTYRADPAYSYSTLAKFYRGGFGCLDTLFDKVSSPSLTFGSVVDSLVTGGEAEFKDRFYVADLPTLSDNLSKITDTLFDKYGDRFDSLWELPDSFISEVAKDCGYYAAEKYANTRVTKVRSECEEMYEIKRRAAGKEVITTETYTAAIDCVTELKNSEMTRAYFSNSTNPDIEKLYQLKFKGEWNGYQVRCMADELVIDHARKKVIPIDLKTSGHNEWDFPESFKQWNYWIQAELYWYIIRQNMDKSPVFKDYELEDYRFIVINRSTLKPMVWKFPDSSDSSSRVVGKTYLKSWQEILPELDGYLTKKPKYPNGTLKINDITQRL